MIIDMKQTRSSVGADFIFSTKDNPNLYNAKVRLGVELSDLALIKNNEQILILSADEVPVDGGGFFRRDRVLFSIKRPNGDICGEVSSKMAKGFRSKYKYNQINFNAELLDCFEVAMGKDGKFICIYLKDGQVAMIEKSMVVDNTDFYKIYLKNEKYMDIVCFYAVYYDYATCEDYDEITFKYKMASDEYTFNKKLKSKYDSNFKEQCLR